MFLIYGTNTLAMEEKNAFLKTEISSYKAHQQEKEDNLWTKKNIYSWAVVAHF